MSMGPNYGKDFENVVKKSFEKLNTVCVIRLHDQTTGFKGSVNPCDFIVYDYPHMYLIECKSIHGNTFPLSNITRNQLSEMYRMSAISGVRAGILCWWIDHDVTRYIPIQYIHEYIENGIKSIRYDDPEAGLEIVGKKKRVFFDYDFSELLFSDYWG